MTPITFGNVAVEMALAIPELQDQIEAEKKSWGSEVPGLHVTCGDILMPALEAALRHGGDNSPLLKRLFAFVERLAESEDSRVVNVVEVTICEALLRNHQARLQMGPKTFAAR